MNISCDKYYQSDSSIVTGKFDHFTFNVQQPSKEGREMLRFRSRVKLTKDYICGYRGR